MSEEKQQKTMLIFLKEFILGKNQAGKKKNYLLLSLLLLGMILMLAGSVFSPFKKALSTGREPRDKIEDQPVIINSYEKDLSRSLQQALEHINGISRVQVFINFAGSKESTYGLTHEENSKQSTESDREGGRRDILENSLTENYVLLREPGGGEKPLLLSESMPRISGVLVVARGVENSALRLKVIRAIQSVLNLPVHRIAVLPLGEG